MIPRRLVPIALALACVAPSAASAQDVAPPGNSAVEQYRESAPPAGPGSRKLSDSRKRQLERRGQDGAALAAALDRNGGVPSVSAGTGAPSAGTGTGGTPRRSTGPSDGSSSSKDAAPKGTRGSRPGVDAGSATRRNEDAVPGAAGDGGPSDAGSADGGGQPTGGDEPKGSAGAKESTTNAAATTTVGPLPMWSLLVGALVVVAVGLVVRRRASV